MPPQSSPHQNLSALTLSPVNPAVFVLTTLLSGNDPELLSSEKQNSTLELSQGHGLALQGLGGGALSPPHCSTSGHKPGPSEEQRQEESRGLRGLAAAP